MPLLTGTGNIRKNVQELMKTPQSVARKRAINSIAKKNNVSASEAQFRQAIAIAKSQARKS